MQSHNSSQSATTDIHSERPHATERKKEESADITKERRRQYENRIALHNEPEVEKTVAGVLALATLAIAGLLALGVWGITTNNTEAAPGMTTTPPDYLSVSNIGDTHAKLTLANSSSEADVDEWYFKIASTNPQGRCEGPITKGEKGTDISIILDGLTFDASSRQLSGTPSATGNSSCTYTASATGLTDATLTFSISVVESKSLSFGNSAVPAQTYSKDKQIATLQLPAATGPPTTYP